jgi:uncharacterized protein (DUF302 family)
MSRLVIILIMALSFPFHAGAEQRSDLGHLVVYQVEDEFEAVKESVIIAIEDLGMLVSNELHMSEMLDRTGKDVGSDRRVFGRAESIEFCSAVLSRKMVEADPSNLVFCPFIISIFTRPGEDGLVYVGYRKPNLEQASDTTRAVMAEVEKTLDGIVRASFE